MDDSLAVRPEVLEGVIDEDCNEYCSHGGICILNAGHSGQHETGYCKWDTADSITKSEADAIMSQTPTGALIVQMSDLFGARP